MSRNTFYINNFNSNAAKLLGVEKAVAEGNLILAASNNSSILTENSLEDSYQLFYDALIHFEDDAFTETDSINLTNIASGCPTIEGGVVYQSNTLYNAVYNLAEVFTNVCPEYLDKSQMFTDESQIENQTTSESYRLFPIPNNGEFHLIGKIENGFKIEIVNLDGKLVYKEIFNEASKDVLVKTPLPSGTYTVVIKNSEGLVIYRNKIIVIQ
jgi:hypothetical protein